MDRHTTHSVIHSKNTTRMPAARLSAMTCALLISGMIGSITHAQNAPSAKSARQYTITSAPLAQALRQVASINNVIVSFDPQLTAGKQANPIQGNYSVEEAFHQLLQGTGLISIQVAPGSYQIRAGNTQDGTSTLPLISVQGAASATEAQSYVATHTISGTKTAVPITEVPQSVSVITGADMRDRQVRTVTQAIQYTPGVQINNFGGNEIRNDWIVLRGFDAKITGDYRDGLNQLPYDQIRARMPAYALESVEVLRGPSSILFGQVAPGGVVNRITKRPSAETLREIELQAGSFEFYQLSTDLGGALDQEGKLQYRLTAVARDAGTQDKYDNNHRYQDNAVYVAPAFTYAPNADTSFTLLTHYQRDRNDGESRALYPTRTLIGDYNFDTNLRELYSAGYLFSHRVNNQLTIRQNARYQTGNMSLQNLYALGAPSGQILNRYILAAKERANGLVVDTQAELLANTGTLQHHILAGVDYKYLNGEQQYRQALGPSLNLQNPVYGLDITYPSAANTIIDQKETNTQFGVYLQDQIKLDRWIVTLGARYDWADSKIDDLLANKEIKQNDTAFTGRAGLAYAFNNGVTPYISYATSFLPQSGTDYHGTAFKPTKGQQYEAGIKYQPAGKQDLYTIAVFNLTQTNVLTTDPDPAHTGFNVQTGEIRSRGLELEAKNQLSAQVQMLASYTYNQVEVTKSNAADLGKTPVVTPKHMASAWLNYRFGSGPLAGASAGVGARYIGSTYVNNINTLSNQSATFIDLALQYDLAKWRLALNVNNLLGKESIVCRNTMLNCRYGVERAVIATAAYRF
jgi:iron complex outermembrane receptor protein